MSEEKSDRILAVLPQIAALNDGQLDDLEAAVQVVRRRRREEAESLKRDRVKARTAEIEALLGNRRCPHRNVQQFTECCLDCGHNINFYDDETYLADLENKLAERN